MQVVLKVWSNNPDNNAGCDSALVEITPALAKLALRRIAVLCEQKAIDPPLDEMYYWDSGADYFSPWADPTAGTREGEGACLKLREELDRLQTDGHEVATASGNFSVPQSQMARVECSQMVARESGIAFTAIPKHTDFYVTTAEIPKEFLEQSVSLANG